jgi:hypothetical protein
VCEEKGGTFRINPSPFSLVKSKLSVISAVAKMHRFSLLILLFVTVTVRCAQFVVSHNGQLCTWEFGTQPLCTYKPTESPEVVAYDPASDRIYWATKGPDNSIYRTTSTIGVREERLYKSEASNYFISSIWIDSPNYLYFALTNAVDGVWRIALNSTEDFTAEKVCYFCVQFVHTISFHFIFYITLIGVHFSDSNHKIVQTESLLLVLFAF